MNVEKYILKRLKKKRLHFSLFDPDPKKQSLKEIANRVRLLEDFGSAAIMVGGSTNVTQKTLDDCVKTIKGNSSLPVILFPNSAHTGISRYADAIFFMSLLNSRDPMWISGMQSMGAPIVKNLALETIPMAYLVIEPGMKVGKVGKADLIKQTEIDKARNYALAAQYLGFHFLYLEAGSGATKPVPTDMITAVKKEIKIPLIVGGGLRSPKVVYEKLKAGADIIVTGTVIEDDFENVRPIIETINGFK